MTTRWAIVGTGGIAAQMARTLGPMPDADLTAVVSRTTDRAKAFAAEHGVARASDDLGSILGDVAAVYVATPHIAHSEPTIAALEAGVGVLCEKPLTVSHAESRRLVGAARDTGTFLMEAMWSRFIPAIRRAQDLVAKGMVGEVRSVEASFSLVRDLPPEHRLRNRALGGGTTLDLGVYPLTIAHLFLGAPKSSQVVGHVDHGVDIHASTLSEHPGGWSHTTSSLIADTPNEAVIAGSDGRIRLHRPHHHPTRITIERGDGGVVETIDLPYAGTGFEFQVEEVHRCLAEGLTESAVVPHQTTLEVAHWMDDIMGALGVAYA
jgi:predicted dehydrogenase